MITDWKELKFWQSGEWQVIEERLDDLDRSNTTYCPLRNDLFAALRVCPYSNTHAIIVGQDPYPNPKYATGIAFSIPSSLRKFPPTLVTVLEELQNDLHFERKNGNLEGWCKQGVLLWNATPTCLAWKSNSHDWTEWTYLTREIVDGLSQKGIVFVFLGRKAQHYAQYVNPANNAVLCYSHPSPLGSGRGTHPFKGSRVFSTINDALVNQGLPTIDWRL